jgi:hypothetical protein
MRMGRDDVTELINVILSNDEGAGRGRRII